MNSSQYIDQPPVLDSYRLNFGEKQFLKVQYTIANELQYWNLRLVFSGHIGKPFKSKIVVSGSPTQEYRETVNYVAITVTQMESPNHFRQVTRRLDKSHETKDIFSVELELGQYLRSISVTAFLGADDTAPRNYFFLKSLRRMFVDGSLTDVIIKAPTKEFPCHKVILAARSVYFKTMFEGTTVTVLHWEKIFDDAVVEHLLNYIYTGNTPTNLEQNQNQFQLLRASQLCSLDDLKDFCVSEIIKSVNEGNVLEIWKIGENMHLDELKTLAVNFIANDCSEEPDSLPGWHEMGLNVTKILMSSLLKLLRVKRFKV